MNGTILGQPAGELLGLALQHLGLVAIAICAAIAIGVPLGILLTRYPALGKPVLGAANIAQTVPSLALFGLLIPLNVAVFGFKLVGGIGPQTAIAALVLYALLPIIRNTYIGISGVDPTLRDAGRAMGMTDAELLLQVELPLALPVIVAGIRVATVITVGTATIAAAIDAGGLGKYIFRGLRMNDNQVILAGALPAALIAIAADLALGWVERELSPGRGPAGARRVAFATAICGLLLVIGGVRGLAAPPDRFVVGAKDFTEQVVLGELVAQTVESQTGLPVTRRFDLGGNLAHEALMAGEIDAYVEYSGTAFMAILKQPPASNPAKVLETVRSDYAKRYHLTVTEPLGFDNTFAILVRGNVARKLGLKTISDAATHTPAWTAGFGQDFVARPDGYAGFSKAYGLQFVGAPREMDLSLTYRALRDGQVDLIAGNSTDGLIAQYDLVQLADDRHYFPPYDAVPIVREDVLKRRPAIRAALAKLAGVVGVADMRRLNYAV
ncbi:MAG: ABC-type glycine betaine transport, periplasmic subunit, partial [Cyanobacteria bacterium RYN_339]|nr:ABC-type glycine betaine transport, periplasmic subunit [Cyanobacteria bacterium RYN_339]